MQSSVSVAGSQKLMAPHYALPAHNILIVCVLKGVFFYKILVQRLSILGINYTQIALN